MKKVIIFLLIITVLFGALYFVNSYGQSSLVEGNPFGKDKLHPATIKQLDDPHYQNQILPDELSAALDAGADQVIYFYSPECEFCKQASPRLVPTAEQLDVDLKLFNLVEFNEGWSAYSIESTPTVIYYQEGQEIDRLEGLKTEQEYEQFLSQTEETDE